MRTLVVCMNVLDPISSKLRCLLQAQLDAQGPVTTTFDKAEEGVRQVQPELLVVVLSTSIPDRAVQFLARDCQQGDAGGAGFPYPRHYGTFHAHGELGGNTGRHRRSNNKGLGRAFRQGITHYGASLGLSKFSDFQS